MAFFFFGGIFDLFDTFLYVCFCGRRFLPFYQAASDTRSDDADFEESAVPRAHGAALADILRHEPFLSTGYILDGCALPFFPAYLLSPLVRAHPFHVPPPHSRHPSLNHFYPTIVSFFFSLQHSSSQNIYTLTRRWPSGDFLFPAPSIRL